MKDKKKMELLSLESHTLTNQFRREVDSAARRIHVSIAKSGRQGIDVDIIQENFSFENSVLIEALKKLEKLKRIRVILSKIWQRFPVRRMTYTLKRSSMAEH